MKRLILSAAIVGALTVPGVASATSSPDTSGTCYDTSGKVVPCPAPPACSDTSGKPCPPSPPPTCYTTSGKPCDTFGKRWR